MSSNISDITKAQQERFLVSLGSGGDVRTVVAYPNRYWLAMSNLGFQTVFRRFSEQSRLKVERAFIPDEGSLKTKTFESSYPLSNVELLAISVSFETDYPYVLSLLESAGIDLSNEDPLKADSSYRPIVLGGGAALTLNPEPLANFFDAIVIGEGEEVIDEITESFVSWRDSGADRQELLEQFSKLDGVYVPSLYEVDYADDDSVSGFRPLGLAPEKVKRRFVKDINRYPTYTTIQTPNTEFKSMFMTETGRGCQVGCKFCVAGYMYRPIRKRDENVIADTVQIGIEQGESVGFVGAAVSAHPGIAHLASSVAKAGKRAALSSIMSQRVTPELAESLSESEYKTVALAPEAGSESLRFRVGKRVCNEQIVSGVSTLAATGIRNFKLYFMVGLPTETEADVQAIVDLVIEARNAAEVAARTLEDFSVMPRIILSVNPFIPKAWTPFQRHGFMQFKELKKRLSLIRSSLAPIPNVEMKNESPRESYFQTVMSRGDRRVGHLLRYMHNNEKDWRWLVQNRSNQILENVPIPDYYVHQVIPEDSILPWEIMDFRIKRSLLEREYLRTFSEDVEPLIKRAKLALDGGSNEANSCGS